MLIVSGSARGRTTRRITRSGTKNWRPNYNGIGRKPITTATGRVTGNTSVVDGTTTRQTGCPKRRRYLVIEIARGSDEQFDHPASSPPPNSPSAGGVPRDQHLLGMRLCRAVTSSARLYPNLPPEDIGHLALYSCQGWVSNHTTTLAFLMVPKGMADGAGATLRYCTLVHGMTRSSPSV